MAYIMGRQIIDGPLMVDEIIPWAKKHKKRIMFFKVDFEKSVWVLAQIGFSSKWRSWICACLNSAYALVLVNGAPTKEFKIERGLRQGDPLFPFLFILAVEALNIALLRATNNNIFHGIQVGKDKFHISHLQFADDALIIGEWSLNNAKNLSRIFTCFHLASGLKVNFNKSKLFGVGVSDVDLNSLASTIGWLASSFPCTYLGLPVGARMSRCVNWNPLVDRFHKRLFKWKSKNLSFGGRLTLIKSVLRSLGVYYFSTSKVPKMIVRRLEVIASCHNGGLGIGSLRTCNQAMLAKWWWRFLSENQTIWCKVLRSIHGPTGGLHDNSSLKSNFGPWYDIMKLKGDLCKVGINLLSIFKRKLRNGQTTSFWHANWLGGLPLCESFLESGSVGREFPPGLSFHWAWRRNLRTAPELDELKNLVSLIS
ncbi:putative RNA-directed DNA polymerase, eukaryota, reverse transcriptase zinc-binding domain protein [Tanacetum coccineum]